MDDIDAVISWVDGYDPLFQAKLRKYCFEHNLNHKKVIEPTRFQQKNEIFYCLSSLQVFAPWLRTVYIITNDQIPSAVHAFDNTAFGQKIKIINQTIF